MGKIVVIITNSYQNYLEYPREKGNMYLWYGSGVDVRKFSGLLINELVYYGDMRWLVGHEEDIKMLEYRKMRGNMYGKD